MASRGAASRIFTALPEGLQNRRNYDVLLPQDCQPAVTPTIGRKTKTRQNERAVRRDE
jgi:hypothetical protein